MLKLFAYAADKKEHEEQYTCSFIINKDICLEMNIWKIFRKDYNKKVPSK
jgi:hypothetical protein